MPNTFVKLQQGSTGPDVIRLQQDLQQLNYYSGGIDGQFGPITKQAVIAFQKAQGFTADGIVDRNIWSEIERILCFPYPINQWRRMTQTEEINEIKALINSPIGIAALNQLALERFVGFNCTRSFYLIEDSPGGYTLMRVKCDPPGGVSAAVGFHEIRVIFNRFEGNIEGFDMERVNTDGGRAIIQLPS